MVQYPPAQRIGMAEIRGGRVIILILLQAAIALLYLLAVSYYRVKDRHEAAKLIYSAYLTGVGSERLVRNFKELRDLSDISLDELVSTWAAQRPYREAWAMKSQRQEAIQKCQIQRFDVAWRAGKWQYEPSQL